MQHNGVLPILAFLVVVALSARAEPPAENIPAGPPLALAPQIDLETALQWTLRSNPNLIATRQNLHVSSEAVAVAQHFPTSLNPAFRSTSSLGSLNGRPVARFKGWIA